MSARRHGDRLLQDPLQRLAHSGDQRHAPREQDRLLEFRAGHGGDAQGDGVLHARDDVLARDSGGQEADDFGLREHHASRGDRRGRGGPCRQFAKLIERGIQALGEDLEEAAGSRGTTVIHDEIPDGSVGIQAQEFGILAADFDNGAGIGNHMAHADGVAGDLGYGGIREGNAVARVARGDDACHVGAVEGAAFEELGEGRGGQRIVVDGLVAQGGGEHAVAAGTRGIQQDDLESPRAAINPRVDHRRLRS